MIRLSHRFPTILLALALQACHPGGVSSASTAGPTGLNTFDTSQGAPQGAPPTRGSNLPVIDGAQFTLRKIIDRQQNGLTAAVYIAPTGWQDQSRVDWDYAHYSMPLKISVAVEKPGSVDAFYAYPTIDLFCLRPSGSFFRVGQNVGGLLFAQPIAPQTALTGFAQNLRGKLPNFRVVETHDVPGLAHALNLPNNDHPQGLETKVTYTVNGQPVEEEFYAVYYTLDIPYDGPQGRTWQTDWGLKAVHSFRAPQGTIEKRRAMFAAMAKSFRPNPAWVQRATAVNQYLAAEFNRKLQAGYSQIAAAAALSKQISANNDAMLASIDARLQASKHSGASAGGGGRSSADKFDDYIRGVDTTDDPYYGTSQHSYSESYHWTDGYGSYVNSNDAGYNPNQTQAGNWVLMQSAQ